MNNTLRIFVFIAGVTLVLLTGAIACYLHDLSTNTQPPPIDQSIKPKTFDYKCIRFYLFADGKIDTLDKFVQEGWQVCSFIGPVIRDADRAKGGEGHIYIALRRPHS